MKRIFRAIFPSLFLLLTLVRVSYSQFHFTDDKLWLTITGGLGMPQRTSSDYFYPRYGFIAGASFTFNPFSIFDFQSGVYGLYSISSKQVYNGLMDESQYNPRFDVIWFSEDVMITIVESNQSLIYGSLGVGIYSVKMTERKIVDSFGSGDNIKPENVTKNSIGINFGIGNRIASLFNNLDIVLEIRYHYLLSFKPYPRYSSITIGILF